MDCSGQCRDFDENGRHEAWDLDRLVQITFNAGYRGFMGIEAGSKEAAKVRLVTTARVCDEVLFKMALIRARARYSSLQTDTVRKLKKNPDMVKSLAEDLQKVVSFLKSLNLEILPVDENIIFRSLGVMEKYGIFGNDALTVYVMQRKNMKYILSSDRDFDSVNWIERIEALSEQFF
jgi:predicted nucleic acid-binding protein